MSATGVAVHGEVRRWRTFWLPATASLMTLIDLTIISVALPTIGRKRTSPSPTAIPAGLPGLH